MKRIAVTGTKTNNRSLAFTLLEVIVVMGVIAVMTAVAYPMYTSGIEGAKAAKDLGNLHQLGIATQLYMNDSSGALFSPPPDTGSWMSKLYNADNPAASKYILSWNVFVSPFDHRASATHNANSPVSYGINGTTGVLGMSADRISNPTVFIVFAPAQGSEAAVNFGGVGNTTSQASLVNSDNVTVVRDRPYPPPPATPTPTPTVKGGTQSNRAKINAVFADWHVEAMAWSAFKATGAPDHWDP